MCYTLALENNCFFGYTAEKFFDRLNEMNISHSMYQTENKKKIIVKVFAKDGKIFDLSEVLSDYIIDNYCKKYAAKVIDRYYHYFEQEEVNDILNRIFQKRESEVIAALVYEYLLCNDRFYPDGFAVFRLCDFYDCMDENISVIVDEMLLNKEYIEFIKLLKQFVSLNDSGIFSINVYKPYHGNYILLDDNNRKITPGTGSGFSLEIAEEELSIQDMLLSDLVSLSPRLIIVHNRENFENPQLLKTLELVFGDGLIYCDGCGICEKFFQKR